MAQNSRWLRLNIDWDDSPWVFSLSEGSQLAWIKFLCYVKAMGAAGKVRSLEPLIASRKWGIGEESVTKMLQAAVNDGAVVVHDGVWEVANWERYQSRDETGAERQKRHRERASQVQTVTDRNAVTPSRDIDRDIDRDNIKPIGFTSPDGSVPPHKPIKEKRERFKPPTEPEYLAYAKTLGMPDEDAKDWYLHFKANGWKVSGKTPMADWQASMQKWERNRRKWESQRRTTFAPNPSNSDFEGYDVIR